MNLKSKFIIFTLIAVDVIIFIWLLIRNHIVAILNPQGTIALSERNLIFTTVSLMLLVAIPLVITTFFIAWKYRESNNNGKYTPEATHNKNIELIWWAIPTSVVLILAFFIWKNTHALDPYKPVSSNTNPIVIQVIALRWKWLFIYPQQNIATINFIQFPVHTPVNFELTADAPMSSFWIPQLGGQMYAMTGMGTKLHLIANSLGEFVGYPAEINGKGFAGMKFVALSSSQADFDSWVQSVHNSSKILNFNEYQKIAEPSVDNPAAFYLLGEKNLYNEIIMKFMLPSEISPTSQPKSMMNMQNTNLEDMPGMNKN